MDALTSLIAAFGTVIQPQYLLYALTGTVLGTAVGMMPGMNATVTMSLLMPIVFVLGDPTGAIIMFAGIFYGSMYGASTTAILLSTPGDSAAVVAALDGYRMAQNGRAGAALLTAALASFVGGIVAMLGLLFLARPLTEVALSFGPAEYFAFCVLALSTVSMLGGKPLKAAFSALIGLAVGTIGIHAVSGTSRFTYGVVDLMGGIKFGIVALGLFALVEILLVMGGIRAATTRSAVTRGKLYMNAEERRRSVVPWLRGSSIGFMVGIVPGPGATVASFLSYSVERGVSKKPEQFGRGRGMIEGLAGPEAANNAAAGGSLVPMLTLGIPGSAATAVMLGALQGFGISTGPLLLRDSPDLVWAVIASLLIGNLMLLVLNVPLIGLWVKVLTVPPSVLYPMILGVCIIGIFSLSGNSAELKIVFIFAVVGFTLRLCGFPLAVALLAVILGPIMEEQWGRAMTASQGDWSAFVASPMAVTVLSLAGVVMIIPTLSKLIRKRRSQRADSVKADHK